jgi:hypothetical protein
MVFTNKLEGDGMTDGELLIRNVFVSALRDDSRWVSEDWSDWDFDESRGWP